MKKLSILLAVILAAVLCGCNGANSGSYSYQPVKLVARYFMNTQDKLQQEVSSGYVATANDVLYYSQDISGGEKLSPPTEPNRQGYNFVCWCTDRQGTNQWDFSQPVYTSVTLFACWERNHDTPIGEDYTEPVLKFKQRVNGTIGGLFAINGVLNEPVSDSVVKLPQASVTLLENNSADVKELLNYEVSTDEVEVSANYGNGYINIVAKSGSQTEECQIYVRKVTSDWTVSNSYYESKAVKYEQNTVIAPYNVVLCGSSSMENWSTSKEDMSPVTTVNVGIGGTTVDMWLGGLSHRLIYPYIPRACIMYLGINNIINANDSGTVTGEKLIRLFDEFHSHLPEATLYYVLINHVPGYLKYVNEIDIANNAVKNYAAENSFVYLIDAGAPLIKESGKPNSAYFLTDGLHMSLCGYILWGGVVKSEFIKHEKELYK